ncbi:MAG: gamma-glutamyltransferase family protein [Steroidobacteraceae bacterium]
MKTRRLQVFLATLVVALSGCRQDPPRESAAPAAPASRAGVGAANPLAVEAGLEVLRRGGSAVDAAVAVQAMLGLVEPQSSGVGGGAFMVYLDGRTGRVTAYEGRETAPAGARPDMFIGEDGKPLSYADAVTSGRSTGAPGAIAMLGLAQSEHGRLPWKSLFGAAIAAADGGFPVPKRLARFAGGDYPQSALPDARALFAAPGGGVVKAGDTLRNPAYARTLATIADQGPRALLEGDLGARIAERTHAPPRPGTLAASDLAAYRPHEVEPLCRPYRVYVLCVPPPPSSGVALLEMMGMLEHTDIAERGPDDPQAWFLFLEASRLMYADRDQYVADPAFVHVPVEGLLDPSYLAARAALIGTRAGPAPPAGSPPGLVARLGRDATNEAAGTSHFVIVDRAGNVVSMTTTVESLFGSGRAVDGFFLNNQLTDFSFVAVVDGRPVANAVAPGKRPRSSMSPVVILDRDGRFRAAVGSPGGSQILTYDAKALVGLLDWHLTMQQAIDLPNIGARGDDYYGEASKLAPAVVAGLAERGIVVKGGRGEESGLHGVIVRDGGRLEGGADPRRDGEWRELEPR